MYNKAKNNNFDIVVCDLNYIYNNKIKKVYSHIKKDTTNIKKEMLDIYPSACNKIFKKELFNNGIEFKKGIWFEDVEFLYRLLPSVKSIGVIHEHFNQYVQRDGSITNSIDKRIYNYIDNWNGIVDFYKQNNIYNEYKKELEFCYVRYIYATFIKQVAKYPKEEYEFAVEKAIKNVNDQFPNYKKNKYFYQSIKGLYLLLFSKRFSKIIYLIYHKN